MEKKIANFILARFFVFAVFAVAPWSAAQAANAAPTEPAPAPASAAGTISPGEAQRAVAILQNPAQRVAAEKTLKAIADAPVAANAKQPGATAVNAPTGAASPAATPAATPVTAAKPAPLAKNGLVAQMLRQIDRWSDSFGNQLRQAKSAVLAFPALAVRFAANFNDAAGRMLALHLLAALAAVAVIGLALQLGLRRILARPRQSLIRHAAQLEAQAQAEAARVAALRQLQQEQQTRQEQAGTATAGQAEKEANSEAAGTRPPADGVALVRSQRDGVDHVEAVPVAAEAAGGPSGHAAAANNAANAVGSAKLADVAAQPRPGATDTHGPASRIQSNDHLGRLRQLPLAICLLLLDLLPIALFLLVTALLSQWFGSDDERIRDAVRAFIGAYIGSCIAMAVLRLLVSFPGQGVPMLRFSKQVSAVLYRWLRRIVLTAAFGIGLADAVQALGAGDDARLAIIKIVSFLVHLFAVILIFQVRRQAGAAIAAAPHAAGPFAAARNWLAQTWAYFAAVLVMGVWVVWAMGVEDGFPKLIQFIAETAGIIVGAHVLSILILGGLSRIFHVGAANAADAAAAASGAPPRLEHYFPLVQRLVSILIGVCAALALLQLWGLDAIGWLSRGAVGRSLLSAIVSIGIALVGAVVLWEAADAGVKRRLNYWSDQGEVVRVARLRTLLPMFRTCLAIIIILVVGLTILNKIGINTGPLLAGASIVGVALGFGSQKLVQDFITGIFLLMENAMQVGDWITVAGVSGTVEYLSIRTVRLRSGDGSLNIVPFSSVSTVNNTNRGLGNAVMRVGVGYDADIARVTEELIRIGAGLRADPAFKNQILADIEVWGVDAVDGSMVTMAGQIRCTDTGRWGVQRELNRRILDRFRELGIAIADPRTTLMLSRGAAAQASTAAPADQA